MSDEPEEKLDPDIEWLEQEWMIELKRSMDMKFDVRARIAHASKWGGPSWLDRKPEEPEDLS